MSLIFLVTLAASLLLVSPASAHAASSVPLEEWVPAVHDQFFVDTENNQGYLIHESSSYTTFRVATGRRSIVHYISTYDATTPTKSWVAKSLEIQSDRRTFGSNGHFLRLYSEGKYFTHYGIHGIAGSEKILARDDRFFSFGCILVSDDVMEVIEQTYKINNDSLPVTTAYGPATFLNMLAAREVKEMVSQGEWLK